MSESLTSCCSENGIVSQLTIVEKTLQDVRNDFDEEKMSLLFRQLRKLQSMLLQLESVCLYVSRISCIDDIVMKHSLFAEIS